MQSFQVCNKVMIKRSLQQKQSLKDSFLYNRPPSKSFNQNSITDRNKKQNYQEKKYPLSGNSQQQKRQNKNRSQQIEHLKDFQNSININIKSNTKELIESKEYQNKFISQWTPVFTKITHQQSLQTPQGFQNEKSLNKQNFKQEKFEQLKMQNQDKGKFPNEQYQSVNKYGCSFEDLQKLSKMFCEVMLKQDSKKIKKLNNTNQQLKSVCKQIVHILRKESENSKKSYDTTLKQIHEVIMKYEKKKIV